MKKIYIMIVVLFLGFIYIIKMENRSNEIESIFNNVSQELAKAEVAQKEVAKDLEVVFTFGSAESAQKAKKEVETIIKANKDVLSNFTLPDEYLDGKLVNSPINFDGHLIGNITLRDWLIYVLSVNENITIQAILGYDSVAGFIEDKGVRIKVPRKPGRTILFREDMGELYPSYYSDRDDYIYPITDFDKEEMDNYLVSLTIIKQ